MAPGIPGTVNQHIDDDRFPEWQPFVDAVQHRGPDAGTWCEAWTVRDIVIQRRESDLILASYGRGFYILDDYSPLRAVDVAGLPRTLIHTAEFDPLRDEGRDYFERLRRAQAEVSYTCHPGMIHLFYGLGAVIPYARIAFEQIGAEIRAALV